MAFSDHVKVIFGADTKGFQTELGRAHEKAKNFKTQMATLLTGALGAAAFKQGAQAAIEYGTELSNMATRLGVSTEFLQKFNFAANQSGVATTSANTALQRFIRRVAEAKEKGGPLKDTLDKLGISFKDVNGLAKSGEDLFREFGRKLGEIPDQREKVRTAFQFLDTEGVGLVQMFKNGTDAIEDYGKEAERLGLILDGDTVESLRDAGDKLDELKTTFITAIAQGITPFLDKLKVFKPEIQKIAQKFGEWLPKIAAVAAALVGMKLALSIGAVITGAVAAMKVLGATLVALRAKILLVNAAIAANGYAKLGAVISALVAGGLTLLINKLTEVEDKLGDVANKGIDNAAQKLAGVQADFLAAKQASDEFRKSLEDLNKTKVDIDADELQFQLIKQRDQIVENIGKLEDMAKQAQNNADAQQEIVDKLKNQGVEGGKLQEAQIKLNQLKIQSLAKEDDLIAAQQKVKEISQEIQGIGKQRIQDTIALNLGIKDLFDGTSDVAIETRRIKELNDAIKTQNDDLVQQVKDRHAWEDDVVKLVKQGKMTIAEAAREALKLKDAKAQQKVILGQIKDAEDKAKAAADARGGAEQKIIDKLERQLGLQKLAREEADKQLQVLALQAAGENQKADLLQKQFDLEKEIKRVMDQQGLGQADAVAKIQQKLDLENQIAGKKIQEKIDEKEIGDIRDLAQKRIQDGVDAEERARIRKAKKIIRLEEQIKAKKDEQNDQAQKQVELWEQIKMREIALLLDDETKEDLDELKAEKLKLQDNHDAQLQALNQANAQVLADQAAAQAQAAADRAAVAVEGAGVAAKVGQVIQAGEAAIVAAGDAQAKKLDAINNNPAVKDAVKANKDAIVAAVESNTLQIVNAIKGIKIPAPQNNSSGTQPTASVPIINNTIQIAIQSELKQQTQEDILETLQGYFVNQ